MTTYVALLRAINVGGRNQIPMAALRDLHARLGHRDVVSYIQSGNVVFDADDDPAVSVRSIETAIADEFGLDQFVIAGREIHLHCPNGFGRSKLNNAWLEKRLGVVSTIRNWRTVSQLLALSAERSR